MTPDRWGESRVERVLEAAFGAVSDWLELVRAHENAARAANAARELSRRNHLTRVVMAVLSVLTIGLFFWIARRG